MRTMYLYMYSGMVGLVLFTARSCLGKVNRT
jgi:hypothetical protein